MERYEQEEMKIDLIALIRSYLKRWWMFAIAGVMGGLLALIITMVFITPQYQSKAMLYVLSKTTSVTSLADLQIGNELTADFSVIATSKPVIDGAVKRIEEEQEKIRTSRGEILGMLSVSNASNTRILTITATCPDPVKASVVANAVAAETAEQMAEIMKSDPPTTVENAEVSKDPISPSLFKNGFIGGFFGLLLIAAYLTFLFIKNDNIQTQEDVEKYLGLPTLAVIPKRRGKEKKESQTKKKSGK